VKYVFVDEATKNYDFIKTAGILADAYTFFGKKVVMSGTDSLGFQISKTGELFDRMTMIHTTYISFSEYNHLLGRGIDDYIAYGGLMVDEDSCDPVNYNYDALKEYTDGSIVENIMHTLKNWNYGVNHVLNRIKKSYDIDEIPTLIHKIVDKNSRDFLYETVNEEFSAHELGNLFDLLVRHNVPVRENMNKEDIMEDFRIMLGIHEPLSVYYDKEVIDTLKGFLLDIEMFYYVRHTDEYIMTQPGVRYYHTKVLSDALKNEYRRKDIPEEQTDIVMKTLDNAVKGHILEDMVYIDILKWSEKYDVKVLKYNEKRSSREFDVTVMDFNSRKAVAIEVKHSSVMVKEQTRHLNDPEFCRSFEEFQNLKIVSKVVIYNGETTTDMFGGIIYMNASEFLKDIEGHMSELIELPKLKKTEKENSNNTEASVEYGEEKSFSSENHL